MRQHGRQQDVRASVVRIPDGDAGIARTIQFMRLAALQGARSAQIRGLALSIVQDVPNRDSQGEISAIYNWVKQNIKFRGEFEETIQTPEVTLRFRAGDCDDHSVLLSALLASIGYRTEFKTVAVRGEKEFTHVYAMAQNRQTGQWIALDTTVDQAYPGWQPPTISRAKTWANLGDAASDAAQLVNAASPLVNAIAAVNVANYYKNSAGGVLNVQRTPGGVSISGYSGTTVPTWAWGVGAAALLAVALSFSQRRSRK